MNLSLRIELPPHDESRSEGYDEYFDPPLESKYECPICLLGLREPVQTSCGHRFCKGCILRSIRDAGPRCPLDKEELDERQLYPDNFVKREVLSHHVFCPFKKQHDCPWKGPLCELEDHLKECEFVDINCVKNCGKQMKKKDLAEHLEKECPNRTVPCDFCKEEIRWNGLESHHEACPKYPLPCGTCGKENIPRDTMQDHLDDECPKTEIKCPFSISGCKFMGLRAAVNEHVHEQLTAHLVGMTRTFADFKAAQDGLEAKVSRENHGNQELRRRVDSLSSDVEHLKRNLKEVCVMLERFLPGLRLTYDSGATPSYIS